MAPESKSSLLVSGEQVKMETALTDTIYHSTLPKAHSAVNRGVNCGILIGNDYYSELILPES